MDLFDYMREQNKEKNRHWHPDCDQRNWKKWLDSSTLSAKINCFTVASKRTNCSQLFYGPREPENDTGKGDCTDRTGQNLCRSMRLPPQEKDMEAVIERQNSCRGCTETYDSFLSMRFTVFNKGQQGYLLPFVEDGTVTLIGATTENPYFEVNGALISPIHYFWNYDRWRKKISRRCCTVP